MYAELGVQVAYDHHGRPSASRPAVYYSAWRRENRLQPRLPRLLENLTFRPPRPLSSLAPCQYETQTLAGSTRYATHLDLPGKLATRIPPVDSAGV